MTPDRKTSPPSRPGRTEPWRVERMVQRVPAHLGETTPQPVSPWIVVAGVVLLVMVSCGVLAVLLDIPARLAGLGVQSVPTPTTTPRVVTPAVTILPVTLPPPSPTPGPTAVTTKYKVKSGDTLSSISARYRVSIEAIKAANGMKNDNIGVGDELIIPLPTPTPPGGAAAQYAGGSTPTALALDGAPTSAPAATTPGVVKYTVARGDTLLSIAATYGSTVDAIRAANSLTGDMLSIGQVLQIPIGTPTTGRTPTTAPTAAGQIAATPTAQFSYAAPSLQWPPDNQVVRGTGGAPTLEWLAPATLKANEFYVVHVDYTVNGQKKDPIIKQIKQGNNYTIPDIYYPGPSTSGTQFKWYVVIVRAPDTAARAEVERSQMSAASPPSDTRTFLWY